MDKKIDVSFEYVASFLDGGSPNMKYQSTSITEGLLSVRICRELKTMYSHTLLIFKHFLFHTIKGSLAFLCVEGRHSTSRNSMSYFFQVFIAALNFLHKSSDELVIAGINDVPIFLVGFKSAPHQHSLVLKRR